MTDTPKLQVFISDYDLKNALDQALTAGIERAVGKAVSEHVEEAVREAVDARVKAITDDMLKTEVERLLTEGWAKTNEWGEKKGEPITLSSVVRERLKTLTDENPNAYNREDKPSKLQKIVTAQAEEAVKVALKPVIDEAKKQLQSQLDISIGKNLRLTLADALKG